MTVKNHIKFGVITCLVLVAYLPVITSMVFVWSHDKEYSHGFLIPLITVYLLWTNRNVLRATPLSQDAGGFLVILAGAGLLLTGNVAFEPFTMRVSLLVTAGGLIYLLLGRKFFAQVAFPLGYLLFMIPLPHLFMKNLALGLKLFSAAVTSTVLSSIGIPVFREGVNLELPNASLVVADFCTGVLSIVAISALAVLYAYLTQKTLGRRIALILLALPIAILGNLVRLITTVGLTYYFGQKVLDSAIHQFHGTFNFLLTIAILAAAGKAINAIGTRMGASAA